MDATFCNQSEPHSLALVTAAADYAARACAAVQSIAKASDEAEALELLTCATSNLGADSAAFVSFLREDGSQESFRFLLACDAVWCHEYQRRSWYSHDPWLQYALSHSEPVVASAVPLRSAKQRELADLAHHFGFASALIIPAPAAASVSRVGVLCLGSQMKGYFEADDLGPLRVAARALSMELHEWWIDRLKHELVVKAGVSDEDLAILQLERTGHGTKAIASALNTTPAAVNSRFQRLNQRLGVPNRKSAATLAAEYGLI
jgi:DNA-binding CsgD family transcriptional regulator